MKTGPVNFSFWNKRFKAPKAPNFSFSLGLSSINNSIFQVTNKNFLVTPNGRISSDQPIVVVIGSQYYNSGSKTLNCLIIQAPTGHIIKGKFYATEWITNEMEVSKIDQDNIINPASCLPS